MTESESCDWRIFYLDHVANRLGLSAIFGTVGLLFLLGPLLNWTYLLKLNGTYGGMDPEELTVFVMGFPAILFVARFLLWDPYRILLCSDQILFQKILGKTERSVHDLLMIKKIKRDLSVEGESGLKLRLVFASTEIDVPIFPEAGQFIKALTVLNPSIVDKTIDSNFPD